MTMRDLCGFALLGALVAMAALIASTHIADAQPVRWNDTVIDTRVAYDNVTIIVDGNLTIGEEGRLQLTWCHLVINASLPSQYRIDVRHGGQLLLNDTEVSSGGGTFDINSSFEMVMFRGRISGLSAVAASDEGHGLTVEGSLYMEDVELEDGHFALRASSDANVVLSRIECSGESPLFLLEDESVLLAMSTRMTTFTGGPITRLVSGAHAQFSNCTFTNGTGYRHEGMAVDVIEASGASTMVGVFDGTTVLDIGRYSVESGWLAIDNTVEQWRGRARVEVLAANASVQLGNLSLEKGRVSGGTLRMWGVEVHDLDVTDGCTVHSHGIDVPSGAVDGSVTLHRYCSVDFQLLNETRVPTTGLFLVVESRDGVEVVDAVSGEGGWVRGVWLRSWTRHGETLSYEPPHRVEFGDVDYSITTVQVFANATVVLWNSLDQRDLSLVPGTVDVTDRSPREGDPFDVIVDGKGLVPYAYEDGTAGITLCVDGVVVQTQVADVRARRGVTFRALNLTEGLHELAIVVDPGDAVLELNEGGNDEVRVIVEVASRNYTGFEVDLYVRMVRLLDTGGGDEEPLEPGVIQVEYAVHARYSSTVVRSVKVAVYVDGSEWNSAWVDLSRLVEGEYTGSGRMPINLPAGTYTLELRVDPSGEFDERYENNNLDSRTVRIEEPPVEPFLDLWDQPLLCLAMGAVGVIAVAYMYRRSRGPPAPLPPSASPPTPSAREMRTDLVGYPCPQCGRGRLTGYADGSALCQDCKAVIAPRK